MDGRREDVEVSDMAGRLKGFFKGGRGGVGSVPFVPFVNAFRSEASEDFRVATGPEDEGCVVCTEDFVDLGVA